MPSSNVQTFTDAADYAAKIRAGNFELTVTGIGDFRAKLIRVDLNRLWLQSFSESLSRIGRAALSPARAIFSFPVGAVPRQQWGGREVAPHTLTRLGIGQDVFHSTSGEAQSASLSLPVDELVSNIANITHRNVKLHKHALIVRPPSDVMLTLTRLHTAASALAETAPAILANAEAARSLEHQLVHALVACIAEPAQEDSLALRHHQHILRRFRDLVEANVGNPLYLPEICAALGVSGRTLQRCCLEQIGISPLRYLLLRRLHMVRRILALASSGPGIVTTVATDHGFWELGRFSVAYRQAFGESPSATLNRRS